MGFASELLAEYKKLISISYGMILVTAQLVVEKLLPYIFTLNETIPLKNIVTIEDPVEYILRGITQIELTKAG